MEKRNRPVMFYIEDYLYDILRGLAENQTVSTYVRSLVIKDFMRKGLLDEALKDGTILGFENLKDEVVV